jgi:hypothetical protein
MAIAQRCCMSAGWSLCPHVCSNGNTTWHGNNVRTGDGSNTIEKVYIPQPAPGGYTITVSHAPQASYSLWQHLVLYG